MFGIIARIVVSLFAAFVLIAAFNTVVDFIAYKNRQITKVSFAALTPPYVSGVAGGLSETHFHAGQRIFVHLDQERKRECIITRSTRIIEFINGDRFHRVIWYSYNDSRGATAIGEYYTDISLIIPPDLPTGKYQIEIISNYDCDEARYLTSAPPIPFDVSQ